MGRPQSVTTVDGGEGDDCVIITGRDGKVTIQGGPGNDSVYASDEPAVDLDAPPAVVIEQLEASGCSNRPGAQSALDALADNPLTAFLITALICATLIAIRIISKFNPKAEY